jgi:hypothetical protein
MNPVDKGLILEQLYREKLMNKLVGESQVKEDLADRIMYGTDNQNSLDLMMNKPVYEELRQIPINEQLKMMNENFNTLPEKKEKVNENLRNTFPLYKGERLS